MAGAGHVSTCGLYPEEQGELTPLKEGDNYRKRDQIPATHHVGPQVIVRCYEQDGKPSKSLK